MFRLEALLKLRKSQEDTIQKDFASANQHLLTQKKRLQFMEQVEENSKLQVNEVMEGQINLGVIVFYDNFFNGIHERQRIQKNIIEEVKAKVDVKREALTEAMRKRKTLEILKDRQIETEKKERMKREIAQLDEISSSFWQRK